MEKLHKTKIRKFYTEGVRQLQPRVELWQPWDNEWYWWQRATLLRVASAAAQTSRNPFRIATRTITPSLSVAKAQPWAVIGEHLRCNRASELANNAVSSKLRLEREKNSN